MMGNTMELIIFDLDGTLVDSRRDIANSVNELLENYGRPKLPNERIYGFIGNGVRCLLERSLGGAPDQDIVRALDMFLPIYRRRLLETTRPYTGVREALEELRRGRTLAVLTNKPKPESVALLEGLELASYFRFIYGGDSFPARKPDPMGIQSLIDSSGAPRERTLMVGDSHVDYETARNACIPICMVSYGIGAARIEELGPDYVVDDLRELITILSSTA
jgi:phosphoglycolate phosphatase